MTIRSFTDLDAWKEARILTIAIYRATKTFPADEKFALTNQIRRAAISVISNIAEGFGRNTAKDKSHFYALAKGSLLELQSQIIISNDLSYLDEKTQSELENQIVRVAKLLGGLIRSAMDK